MGVWEGYEYWRAEGAPDGKDYVIFYQQQQLTEQGQWFGTTNGLPTPESNSISLLFSSGLSRDLSKIFLFRLILKIYFELEEC